MSCCFVLENEAPPSRHCRCHSYSGCPAPGLVLEQHGFDGLLGLFGGVEVGGGFEGEPEVIAGAALVVGEDERVGADVERLSLGCAAYRGWGAGSGFVAAYLGDVAWPGSLVVPGRRTTEGSATDSQVAGDH